MLLGLSKRAFIATEKGEAVSQNKRTAEIGHALWKMRNTKRLLAWMLKYNRSKRFPLNFVFVFQLLYVDTVAYIVLYLQGNHEHRLFIFSSTLSRISFACVI